MKILVFSDIHGNLPALEKLLKTEKADMYISLGDVVNYGPWQNECVELLDTLKYKILHFGNHEQYYYKGKYSNNNLAGRFFEFCYPQFTRHDLIKDYREDSRLNRYNFQHTFENKVIYPDTHIVFDDNYIIGHSHHQSLHKYRRWKMYCIGSAGQNRQYINRIDYMIMNHTCELKHLIYDETLIINEMKARKYPKEFIEYYSKKQRI